MPAGTASYSGRVTRSQMLQSRRERSYLIYRLSSLIDAIRCLVTFVVSQALQLSVDAHTGTPPAADWKRQPGRPRRTSLQQVKQDCGISVSLAEITSQDRSLWRSLRPSAGQAQQWVSEFLTCHATKWVWQVICWCWERCTDIRIVPVFRSVPFCPSGRLNWLTASTLHGAIEPVLV